LFNSIYRRSNGFVQVDPVQATAAAPASRRGVPFFGYTFLHQHSSEGVNMRNLIRWSGTALTMYAALAVAMAATALAQTGQPVTTRLVVPGGTAHVTKILPGGAATFEVRVDA